MTERTVSEGQWTQRTLEALNETVSLVVEQRLTEPVV